MDNALKLPSENSLAKWEEMIAPDSIENTTLEPSLAVGLSSNWIALNLRYYTDYKLRRAIDFGNKWYSSLGICYPAIAKIPEIDVYLKKIT